MSSPDKTFDMTGMSGSLIDITDDNKALSVASNSSEDLMDFTKGQENGATADKENALIDITNAQGHKQATDKVDKAVMDNKQAADQADNSAPKPNMVEGNLSQPMEDAMTSVDAYKEEVDKPETTKYQPTDWSKKVAYDYELFCASNKEVEARGIEVPGWAMSAQKYEWNDEHGEGDLGPPHPELEKELFGAENHLHAGDAFAHIEGIQVLQESGNRPAPILRFADAGLHPAMQANVALCGYDVCTPIQAYCIPAIMQGNDVWAVAVTGSGKTAAYLVPMLSKLMGKAKIMAARRPNPATYDPYRDAVRAEPLVVIVAPTRELATQIFDEARRFCYRSMLRPVVVYGGAPMHEQIADLKRGCDVLIGTPGRLCDLMDRGDLLSLRRVRYTVVDEADEMLGPAWETDLNKIMRGGDNNPDDDHRYLMFSATFPKQARELARQHLTDDHVKIRVGRPGSTHQNIEQRIIWVDEDQKNRALFDLLLSLPPSRTLVFVNSRGKADMVDDYLFNLDMPTTSIHGDRTQREREDALRSFRKGRCPILVATGVSARGLDIPNVLHVINYDLPSTAHGGIEEYIHRIGRTGRIGHLGVASSFYNDRNEDLASSLVKILLESKQEIPDFLDHYVPEGAREGKTQIDFEDESDVEDGHGGMSNGFGSASVTEEDHGSFADDNPFGGKHVNGNTEVKIIVTSPVKTNGGSTPVIAEEPEEEW
ncbi:MAG: hypothetical protein M1823_004844 [Watsoniomyces obsoletus]|nr:MAG: hypothetical protein M1823_004844 [Watsoniomyces obsoletus]